MKRAVPAFILAISIFSNAAHAVDNATIKSDYVYSELQRGHQIIPSSKGPDWVFNSPALIVGGAVITAWAVAGAEILATIGTEKALSAIGAALAIKDGRTAVTTKQSKDRLPAREVNAAPSTDKNSGQLQ